MPSVRLKGQNCEVLIPASPYRHNREPKSRGDSDRAISHQVATLMLSPNVNPWRKLFYHIFSSVALRLGQRVLVLFIPRTTRDLLRLTDATSHVLEPPTP